MKADVKSGLLIVETTHQKVHVLSISLICWWEIWSIVKLMICRKAIKLCCYALLHVIEINLWEVAIYNNIRKWHPVSVVKYPFGFFVVFSICWNLSTWLIVLHLWWCCKAVYGSQHYKLLKISEVTQERQG